MSREWVIRRLEEAGCTLLSLPETGRRLSPNPSTMRWQIPAEYWTAYKADGAFRVRPPAPSAEQITAMDEAYAWVSLLESPVARRIVQARSLVDPITHRHLFSFRCIGVAIRQPHSQIIVWHKAAIERIAATLGRGANLATPTGPTNSLDKSSIQRR